MLQVADLPLAVGYITGASLHNVVYMFGETLTIKSKTYSISYKLLFNTYMQVDFMEAIAKIKF